MSNVETVQSIYEAFGRGDVPFILDQLAEDVGWDLDAPSYGIALYEPGTGKDHAARFFEVLQRDVDITKFQPMNFLSGGNQVAVPIDLEFTVKATGSKVNLLEIHLWTFGDDGKVSRFFHSIDRHATALAFGL
jgi:ketosteroid isomerase-like protein